MDNVSIIINDARGRLVVQKKINLQAGIQKIEFEGYNFYTGTYFVNVMSEDGKLYTPEKLNVIRSKK